MRAAIFTEGSSQRGLGHIHRCLGLAQELLARGFQVEWFVLADAFAQEAMRANGIEANRLPRWSPSCVAGAGEGFDLVVLDSYLAPLSCYRKAAHAAPRRLWIDDEARLDYPPGHVLNPNPSVFQKRPRTGAHDRHLLSGYTFQLLRSEFRKSFRRSIPDRPRRILVTMGGSDLREMTPAAVAAAGDAFPEAGIDAVVPRSDLRNRWLPALGERARLLPGQDAIQMRSLMERADLAISAGGQTLLECLRLGLPTIAVGVAENQRPQLTALVDNRAIRLAGWFDSDDLPEKLSAALLDLGPVEPRADLARNGQALVDGNGCRRCIAALFDDHPEVVLRPAGPDDIRACWGISNSPGTRKHFIDPEPIPWERHAEWFHGALQRDDLLLLLACEGTDVVGQVRYQRQESVATVSISLLEAARGRGLAARILREGDRLAFEAWPSVASIHAEIAPANEASQRAFAKAGYLRTALEARHGERIFYVLEHLRGSSSPLVQIGPPR